MTSTEELTSIIAGRRKVSPNGDLVTYDLTEEIDFSNPKKTADAIARVFFEQDAMKWFKVTGDHIDFQPEFKVRFVLSEKDHKTVESTVDDFLEDLKRNEIYPKFSRQIDDTAERASRMKAALAGGSIRSVLFRHTGKKIDENYLQDDLFLDILEKLEIRSLDDADLMDWKHLPI